jgi:hypothetical protein
VVAVAQATFQCELGRRMATMQPPCVANARVVQTEAVHSIVDPKVWNGEKAMPLFSGFSSGVTFSLMHP